MLEPPGVPLPWVEIRHRAPEKELEAAVFRIKGLQLATDVHRDRQVGIADLYRAGLGGIQPECAFAGHQLERVASAFLGLLERLPK